MVVLRIKMLARFFGLALLVVFLIVSRIYLSEGPAGFDLPLLGGETKDELAVEIIFPRLYNMGAATIFLQGDRAVLIDAGSEEDGEIIADKLIRLGTKEIAFMFLTSPASTHFGGALCIADRIPIRQVISFRTSVYDPEYQALRADMLSRGIPFVTPLLSRQHTFGNIRFTVFPPSRHFYQNQNNHSLGILVRHGDVRLFFAGIAATRRTEEIISYHLASVNLYMVGNHGKLNSASVELLEKLDPDFSIVANYIADSAITNAAIYSGEILFIPEGTFRFISCGRSLKRSDYFEIKNG